MLGLVLARRMLGPLGDESPSIWVLVHWCGLAAVARLPVAVVGLSCIVPWGGAKLECHVGPSALSVVLVHLDGWRLVWSYGRRFRYGDA